MRSTRAASRPRRTPRSRVRSRMRPSCPHFSADVNRREALAGFAEQTGGILVQNRNTFGGALERIYPRVGELLLGRRHAHVARREEDRPRGEGHVDASRRDGSLAPRLRRDDRGRGARDRMEMSLVTPDASGRVPRHAPDRPREEGRRDRAAGIAPFAVVRSALRRSRSSTRAAGRKRSSTSPSRPSRTTARDRTRSRIARRSSWTRRPSRKPAGEPFVYTGEVKSRTGNMRFVATVRDVATNRIGVGSVSVRVE